MKNRVQEEVLIDSATGAVIKGVEETNHSRINRQEGIILALLAAALWGFTPVATKAALEGFTPEFLSFVRLAIAAVIFRVLAGRHVRWLIADPWVWLAGARLGADFVMYNYGIQNKPANVGGLRINIGVVFTVGFVTWIL